LRIDEAQVLRFFLTSKLSLAEPCIARSTHMLDVILVAAAICFFALSVGYTIICDRL
jgi:hypothetical protein